MGWNSEKKEHFLLDRDGYAMLLAIGDFYHFYRTYADVLLEVESRFFVCF